MRMFQCPVVPLYVDDELGGNESTFAGQLPVSVSGNTVPEDLGRDVAVAPKACVRASIWSLWPCSAAGFAAS